MILYNGLHLEGKMGEIFEEMSHRVRTVAVSEKIDRGELRKGDDELEFDPHIWFDVQLWSKTVDRVRDALIELDPAHEKDFRANALAYHEKLTQLDAEIRKVIDTLPSEKRVLITAHDAFGYFGRAYGFEVHGLQGVSTASGISTVDVSQLVTLIGKRKIPTIFAETSVPDRSLQSVCEGVKSEWKFEVRLAQTKLFSDALGEPGTSTGTYIGMVRQNVETIVAALR